jgi:UDP-N-acetylmuramoylalanine--D-glutamate ligase
MTAFTDKLNAFRGRRVLIVGMGRSGLGAARVLAPVAARVVAADEKPLGELDAAVKALSQEGVELRLGDQGPDLVENVDLVVRSPGVPWEAPLLAAAREAGLEVIGELELAYRLLVTDRLVAVTGSNGKSTTTALVGEIFRAAGEEVVVGGNIGVALTSVVDKLTPQTAVVTEVSSFQLEDAVAFRPRVGVLLNLAPDHLDRHGSAEAYYDMKWRLFANQGVGDAAVLNADDAATAARGVPPAEETLYFGLRRVPEQGVGLEGEEIVYRLRGEGGRLLGARELRLPGPHNLANAMAAAGASLAMALPPPAVAEALRTFEGLPHRLEFVAEIDGVRYVNDSKATNVASARTALASFESPLVLIAGGKSKGDDFTPLAEAARGRVHTVILYGAAQEELVRAFEGRVPYERAATVEEAVRKAAAASRRGDVVLLSPACTSWDQYADFEARGDDFKRCLLELRERKEP